MSSGKWKRGRRNGNDDVDAGPSCFSVANRGKEDLHRTANDQQRGPKKLFGIIGIRSGAGVANGIRVSAVISKLDEPR